MSFHPGCTEQEWLSDLKPIAERVGAEVLERTIRWRVETRIAARRNRSDVLIEDDTGRLLLSGEAKRPDVPAGVHALVDSEVIDAIGKAQSHGVPYCFTTNFHELALLDAGQGAVIDHIRRMQGNLIDLVPDSLATTAGWWTYLTDAERETVVSGGLRTLFERYASATQGVVPSVSVDETVLRFFTALTGALLDPLHRTFLSARATIPSTVNERALQAGLNIQNDQDCRYLVAQGIFEVLSASLFHRVMQDFFSLGPVLSGTTPQRGPVLRDVLTSNLADAVAQSGDYESILSLSPIADWAIAQAPDHVVQQWNALLSFVDRLDVTALDSDVLGTIFERLISPHRRHEMGQHYTQPRLARAMARWAVNDSHATVLDPSCGAGTFLVETYARHRELGIDHNAALELTYGNDIDAFAVHLASINLATRRIFRGFNYPIVRFGDAFGLEPGTEMLRVETAGGYTAEKDLDLVDLVITNPPYARSVQDESAALAHLYRLMDDTQLPNMTGANMAAWFVLLGAGLVKPEGRMAYVLPSSVLQNDNLRQWRAWVRRRWDVVIWHTEVDIWFSDARVATCVALLTPRKADDTTRLVFANVPDTVDGELHEVDGAPVPISKAMIRDLTSLAAEEDILIEGTKPEALNSFAALPATTVLGDLNGASAFAGQKLGHGFYKLKDADPTSPAALRHVTGLDYTFRVNRSHLTPLLSSPKSLKTGEARTTDVWLLTTAPEPPTSEGLRNYVALAQSQGVDRQPSIAARGSRWWSINPRRCDIAVPMNSQFQHQIGWMNEPGVANNNFNALKFDDRTDAEIAGASLASAFGALARLYISGEIGSEGARRLLLSQFERWPVLQPRDVDLSLVDPLVTTYRMFRQLESVEVDTMSPEALDTWRALTVSVARAGGASAPEEFAEEAIRECLATVARRRRRETLALSGRTRRGRTSGGNLATRVREWADASPLYERCCTLLVSGPDIVNLRPPELIHQGNLFGEETYLALEPEKEQQLSELLSAGFEAAPPHPIDSAEEIDELVGLLTKMFDQASSDLLGPRPEAEDPAADTWSKFAEEVQTSLVKKLQSDVRAELA